MNELGENAQTQSEEGIKSAENSSPKQVNKSAEAKPKELSIAELLVRRLCAFQRGRYNDATSKDAKFEEAARRVVSTILDFNRVGEYDTKYDVWDRDIDEILVPNFLSFVILPESIRFDPLNSSTIDVLVRPKDKINNVCSDYQSFIKDVDTLMNAMRIKDNSKTLLSELRRNVALLDVIHHADIGGKVRYMDGARFWPIPVHSNLSFLFDDSYLNESSYKQKSEFILKLEF